MKFRFHIQPDGDVPASTQLLNQISFAIASRQFPPGYQLPSTRQLAMVTGLHRNTVNKVYGQLEELGFVEAQAGSGIYVKALTPQASDRLAHLSQYPQAQTLVQESIDRLLKLGCSLEQALSLFIAEIDWRLCCSAVVLVAAPAADLGVGELMSQELSQALEIPVQMVPLEELERVLDKTRTGTVVTSRYFLNQAQALATPYGVRVLSLDINEYEKEIEVVKTLPQDSCLGVVSLSTGILRVVGIISHSLRGEEILVLTAQLSDTARLRAVVRSAQTIITDQASFEAVKTTIHQMRADLIRPPQLLCSDSYIKPESLAQLKRELGLQ